jgi:rhodanese-related sulfurtransferase
MLFSGVEVVIEIDVALAKQWLDRQQDDDGTQVFFLDCREPGEHQTASIAGTTLVPMSQWPPSSEVSEAMQGLRVVVFCHHGGRSLRVTNWLRQNGFPTALSMAGGIDSWSQEIDPSVPRY